MEIVTWLNIAEEFLNERITRKIFPGENLMVIKWEFAPDALLPIHDHVSEQVTMVHRGEATLLFPGEGEVTLREGEMIVIPPSKPHGVKVGCESCSLMDLLAPIRRDLIEGAAAHRFAGKRAVSEGGAVEAALATGPYEELHGFLVAAGVKVPLEKLRELPLELLARYVYERECITMGQLRKILRIDKPRAKELLRQWKHGDDHSESSLKRKLERLIILPIDRPAP